MSDQQAVEEFEKMARGPQRAEGIDQPLITYAGIDQRSQARILTVGGTALDSRVRQIVERLTGPIERWNHILLVETGTLVEIPVFFLKKFDQLNRQQEFQADSGLLEKLVVKHWPDEGLHPLRRSGNQMGLVDSIDKHNNSVVAE